MPGKKKKRRAIGRWFARVLGSGVLFGAPVFLTVFVVVMVWNWVDQPLRKLFRDPSQFAAGDPLAPQGMSRAIAENLTYYVPQVRYLDEPGVGLAGTLLIFLTVGLLVRSFAGRWFVPVFEGAIEQVPFVSTLYTALKGLGDALIGGGHKGFQRAVLIEFPTKGSYAIGFVTGTLEVEDFDSLSLGIPEDGKAPMQERLRILVPCTPPTTSLLLIVNKSQAIPLAMPVEDAVKLVMSGGIVSPGKGLTAMIPRKE